MGRYRATSRGGFLVLGLPGWGGYGDAIDTTRYLPQLVPDHIGPRTLIVDAALARLLTPCGLPILPLSAPSVEEAKRAINALARDGPHAVILLNPLPYYLVSITDYPDGGLIPWLVDGKGSSFYGRDQVPPPVPLWADPDLRLGAKSGRLRVGLCRRGTVWAWGSWNPKIDPDPRAIPVELLRPLVATLGVEWVVLHLANYAAELRPILPDTPSLADLGVRDFADTASVVRQLDLVITTDTAVAHLAGALGTPTWLLLHSDAEGRWHTPGRYPSMRLFRQPRCAAPGDWAPVLARVADELEAWVGAAAAC